MTEFIRWIARCMIITWLAASVAMFGAQASATAFSTDQSDLWWNPGESGWGMQLVQRGAVIFVTMFVYDANRNPIWYTATLNPTGNLSWSGDLYVTNGPWFGTTPFDPAAVALRKVGTLAWNATAVVTGTVAYSVDGIAVTKNVVRQILVVDDFSGTYLGAMHMTSTGCTNPAGNTSGDIPLLTIVVTQASPFVAIVVSIETVSLLTINAVLNQNGQFGTAVGNYRSDIDPEVGVANVTAMNVQINALTASLTLSSTNNGCQNVGYFAGIRKRP